MKKMITWILALVTVLSMTACGKDKAPEKTDDGGQIIATDGNTTGTAPSESTPAETAPQPTEPENGLTYPQGYAFWGVKSVELPAIPALTYEEKSIGGVAIKIATTPFDYDLDQVYDNLKSNSYIQEHYQELVTSHSESDAGQLYADVGTQISYDQSIEFGAALKDSYLNTLKYAHDIKALYSHNSADYSNINRVYLQFFDLEADTVDQTAIFEIVKIVFGEQYAEVLVYGSDSDGKDYNTGKSIRKSELSELISSGDCSYGLQRDIHTSRDTIDISFTLNVAYNPNSNRYGFNYYGLEDESLYPQMQYHIADFVSEDFGGTDPLNFSTFADGFFKQFYPAYTHSSLDVLTMDIYQTDSGRKGYDYWVDVTAVCDDETWDVNSLGLQIYVEEDAAGQIVDMEVIASSDISCFAGNTDKEGQDYVDAMVEMIHAIWPDMDLSGVAYSENGGYCTKDVALELLGHTLTGDARINFHDGYRITLELA